MNKGGTMNIIISNSSNTPIYEQIKEQIKNKIVSNELKTGDLLPSIRNLLIFKKSKCWHCPENFNRFI